MKILKLYAVILLTVLSFSLSGQDANRLIIDQQLQQSVFPYSIIVTDASDNAQYVVPGAEGTLFTIVSGVPTWTVASSFTDNIYTADGTVTGAREIDQSGNTITFKGGDIVFDDFLGNANFYYSEGSGNIGIGLGASTAFGLLDVNGAHFIYESEFLAWHAGDGVASTKIEGRSTSTLHFENEIVGETMVIDANGRLGVGATVPEELLDVDGKTNIRPIDFASNYYFHFGNFAAFDANCNGLQFLMEDAADGARQIVSRGAASEFDLIVGTNVGDTALRLTGRSGAGSSGAISMTFASGRAATDLAVGLVNLNGGNAGLANTINQNGGDIHLNGGGHSTGGGTDGDVILANSRGFVGVGEADPVAKLHVLGLGNTNTTIGFVIQDSDTDDLYSIMDNGELRIGNATTAERPIMYPFLGTNEENINLTGLGLGFYSYVNTASSTSFWFGGDDLNADPGTQTNVFFDRKYNPNNSPAGFVNLRVHTTIDQIGSSNGRTRGIYVESTQTDAVDYRAIETEEGDVVFNGSIAYTKVTTPAEITSNQDDYSPTNWEIGHAFRLSTDASRDITGFSKTNVRDWEIREIWNVGSFDIVLKHQDSGTGLNKRIICPGGVDATVTHYARLVYDGTSNDWRLLTFN